MPTRAELLAAAGRIGGRTIQINDRGEVECHTYPVAPVVDGQVRVRTVVSAISPGTEMTFYGRSATNVYLHKTWNEELRLFLPGEPSMDYPLVVGYRAAGQVTESRTPELPSGTRIYGNWPHTEFTTLDAAVASAQRLPDRLTFEDGVDLAQMGPIGLNAVAFGASQHVDCPAVVFGAGPVGLITAQIVRATGASEVYVVDRLAQRLATAERLGCLPVDATVEEDVAASIKRRLGSEAVAVAWECTGSTMALHEAIRVVRRRGAVVAVGFYQGAGAGLYLGDEFHHNGVEIRSGQIGNIHPDWSWETLRARVGEMVLDARLVLGGLPRVTVPVEDAADGFAALMRPGEVLQVQLSYG